MAAAGWLGMQPKAVGVPLPLSQVGVAAPAAGAPAGGATPGALLPADLSTSQDRWLVQQRVPIVPPAWQVIGLGSVHTIMPDLHSL